MFTIPDSLPRVLFRLMDQAIAGSVSPSAVWYTGYIFVRSGHITLNGGSLRNSGFGGYSWSRSAVTYGIGTWAATAYYLDLGKPYVGSSSTSYYRWHGLPVRCLVYKLATFALRP